MSAIELSVILPCLNEAETVALCVGKAVRLAATTIGRRRRGDRGRQRQHRRLTGARDVRPARASCTSRRAGYGSGDPRRHPGRPRQYVIMADADDSYDLDDLGPFVEQLREGDDLVMGNRFAGGIEPGAMPFLHRTSATRCCRASAGCSSTCRRTTSTAASAAFRTGRDPRARPAHHGHGVRQRDGGAGASAELKITEVPTTLRQDGRSRPPHLRTWRDGWRHLRFLLMYSPRWLFLTPALFMLLLGIEGTLLTATGPRRIGRFGLDTGTLMISSLLIITGVQLCMFWAASHSFAQAKGLIPKSPTFETWMTRFSLERTVVAGVVLFVAGAVGLGIGVVRWTSVGFGELDRAAQIRLLVPSVTGVVLGLQLVFGSFLLGISTMKLNRTPAAFIEDPVDSAAEVAEGRSLDPV